MTRQELLHRGEIAAGGSRENMAVPWEWWWGRFDRVGYPGCCLQCPAEGCGNGIKVGLELVSDGAGVGLDLGNGRELWST